MSDDPTNEWPGGVRYGENYEQAVLRHWQDGSHTMAIEMLARGLDISRKVQLHLVSLVAKLESQVDDLSRRVSDMDIAVADADRMGAVDAEEKRVILDQINAKLDLIIQATAQGKVQA